MSINAFSTLLHLIIICAAIAMRFRGADPVFVFWGSFGCIVLVMILARVAEIAEMMRDAADRSSYPSYSSTERAK